ncbi:MAG: type II secretion system protein [Patescibacteria group bacterium]
MKRGFTLLELLIVIGILAILATTVTIILNPAELLRQARDSQRLSDLRSLNTAINLYTSTYSTSTLFMGTSTAIGGTCTAGSATVFTGGSGCTSSASTKVDGTGWVTINFNLVPTGSPLSKLPADPVNNATYFYAFKATSTPNVFWEIDGVLESDKYAVQQDLDVNDGGNNNTYYELGSDPGLDL